MLLYRVLFLFDIDLYSFYQQVFNSLREKGSFHLTLLSFSMIAITNSG